MGARFDGSNAAPVQGALNVWAIEDIASAFDVDFASVARERTVSDFDPIAPFRQRKRLERGLTPRDLPSTRTSPHGLIESCTFPGRGAGRAGATDAAPPSEPGVTGAAPDGADPGGIEPATGGPEGRAVPAVGDACRGIHLPIRTVCRGFLGAQFPLRASLPETTIPRWAPELTRRAVAVRGSVPTVPH